MSWPRPLAHFLDHPAKPVCPAFCCYREYCSEWVQRGINSNFVDGKLKRREECFFFQGLAQLTRERFGVGPPARADEFLELVAERLGIESTT